MGTVHSVDGPEAEKKTKGKVTERTEEKGSKAKGRERAWLSSPLTTVKCYTGQKFGRNVCTDLSSHYSHLFSYFNLALFQEFNTKITHLFWDMFKYLL